MKIHPVGHRVLIEPIKVEEKTEAGIILATKLVKDEALAQQFGTVIGIGSGCWKDLGGKEVTSGQGSVRTTIKDGDPWCKVGDKVLYQRHSGMRIPDGDGGFLEDKLLLNDQDITAVIEED